MPGLDSLKFSTVWGPYSVPGAKAQDPGCRTRPVVALTPHRHPLGTFHRQARQQSAEPRDQSGEGTSAALTGQRPDPSDPTTPRPPGPILLPLLGTWIRPLPANLNAERPISSVPRGSGTRAHPGPRDRDHPPLGAAASRRHSPGGGRRGRGGGGRDAGEGDAGEAFSRVRGPASRHRKSRTDHREEDVARRTPAEPTNGTAPRASVPHPLLQSKRFLAR